MSIIVNVTEWDSRLVGKLTSELICLQNPNKYNPNPAPVHVYIRTRELLFLPITYCRENFDFIIPYTLQNNWNFIQYEKKDKFSFIGQLRTEQEGPANNARDNLGQYGSVFLNLSTGFGKTIISTWLSAKFSDSGLIIVLATSSLIQQWVKVFQDYSDANIAVVEKNFILPNNTHVIISTPGKIKYLPYANRLCGVLVVDEAHMFGTDARIASILTIQPHFVIFNSATIENKPDVENRLALICGRHYVKVHCDKNFKVYPYYTKIKPNIKNNPRTGKVDWSNIVKQLIHNDERNQMIVDIVCTHAPRHKILLLTWSNKAHLPILAQLISEHEINTSIYSGSMKTYQDANVIIATISKGGTGLDEKNKCQNFSGTPIDLIILVGSMKSSSLLRQVVGRAFRSDDPKIIYLVDDFGLSYHHWNIAQEVFQMQGGKTCRYDTL